jgi:hypothetical protein
MCHDSLGGEPLNHPPRFLAWKAYRPAFPRLCSKSLRVACCRQILTLDRMFFYSRDDFIVGNDRSSDSNVLYHLSSAAWGSLGRGPKSPQCKQFIPRRYLAGAFKKGDLAADSTFGSRGVIDNGSFKHTNKDVIDDAPFSVYASPRKSVRRLAAMAVAPRSQLARHRYR